jgi:hypothetical protein
MAMLNPKLRELFAPKRVTKKLPTSQPVAKPAPIVWEKDPGKAAAQGGELVRKERAAGRSGSRSSLKHSWRGDAKWLEEHYPEEFGPPQNAQTPGSSRELSANAANAASEPVLAMGQHPTSKVRAPNSMPVSEPTANLSTVEVTAELKPDGKPIVPAVLPATRIPATPESARLPPATWFDRFIGFGANSRVVALADAIACVRLVVVELQGPEAAQAVQVRLDSFPVTVNALYAEIARLTGNPAGWGVVQAVQIKARAQQGVRAPSFKLADPIDVAGQPRWVAQLNEPGGAERDWLVDNGLWCG